MNEHELKINASSSLTPSVDAAPQSLEDVHSSVPVNYPRLWRRLFAFLGPAYLVSVGYMDPGNWATDIAGGNLFGYELIWVLLMSNLMAVLLQTLAARLGIVSGNDLAQACRQSYSRPLGVVLWLLCEIAIAATDLAEIIGTVVGLQLLFGLDPLWGLLLTSVDTFLFLAIQRLGMRKMEGFILVLVLTIGICFLIEIVLAQPQWSDVLGGFVPHVIHQMPFLFSSDEALYVAIGILGATVMPHNLYLHSALVQTRQIPSTTEGRRRACRFNLIDSLVALNGAFFVNAAILIMAAAVFHGHPGQVAHQLQKTGSDEIQLGDAQVLLKDILGPRIAPIAFAIALLAAGQSSTITGTLAGQIVMEGFVHLRIRPAVRRLLTRSVALLPAFLTILLSGDKAMMSLLVLSQVVLSLQLPFAIVPLLQFTSDRRRMGEFVNPLWVRVLGWVVAAVVIALNGYLVAESVGKWIKNYPEYALWLEVTVVPVALACGLLLLWLIVRPWLFAFGPVAPVTPAARQTALEVAQGLTVPVYQRIGIALDNSPRDRITLRHAAALARGQGRQGAELILVHVVEGVGGQVHGAEASDQERQADQAYLERLAEALRAQGLRARAVLRFGDPAQQISRTAQEENLDLLVLGSHGHGFLADRLFGATTGPVQHAVRIPVLSVREPK